MNRQEPDSRTTCRSWLLPVLCTLLGGCASTEGITINPVVIRSDAAEAGTNSQALLNYYQTVFQRMRDALRGGTPDSLAELRYLLLIHKKDGMVAFARKQIEQFELLGDGLQFELDLPSLCTLVPRVDQPTAHGKQVFELRVEGYKDNRVLEIGGTGANAAAFQVFVKVRDFDSSGQFVESAQNLPLQVDQAHRLTDGEVLVIPFEIPGAMTHIAVRELWLSVELLPGVVTLDGRRIPVSQLSERRPSRRQVEQLPPVRRLTRGPAGHAYCCGTQALLYPEGYETIQKAPLTTLLNATRRGQPKWFRHVFLASHFMPATDREKAMARLIQWVRNGTGPQRVVAMGSLRVLSRTDLSIADRDAWLRWWQSRSMQPK